MYDNDGKMRLMRCSDTGSKRETIKRPKQDAIFQLSPLKIENIRKEYQNLRFHVFQYKRVDLFCTTDSTSSTRKKSLDNKNGTITL